LNVYLEVVDHHIKLQNTIQLIYALERSGKDFAFYPYPRSRHGVGDPVLNRHMYGRITDFLDQNLKQ